MEQEAFHAFSFELQLHLQEHVGAHVQGDLEVTIDMAQRLGVYRGGDGAKLGRSGKISKKYQNQN